MRFDLSMLRVNVSSRLLVSNQAEICASSSGLISMFG